ncbi:hypothetical protein GGS23DRAFT_22374 [Durotheca rogersii]|uniref:uncharacterized protein n=1 Tax=Durotheca rogersii TaxID=419775 RepID=UPI00221EF521|nr:uncharacterized protein GGS23DRAFT_22374 [Durotheca rogersii]KAI5868326.1 hypothetical protein GGS23DRAFT_22374 [Durotheca rogersii]
MALTEVSTGMDYMTSTMSTRWRRIVARVFRNPQHRGDQTRPEAEPADRQSTDLSLVLGALVRQGYVRQVGLRTMPQDGWLSSLCLPNYLIFPTRLFTLLAASQSISISTHITAIRDGGTETESLAGRPPYITYNGNGQRFPHASTARHNRLRSRVRSDLGAARDLSPELESLCFDLITIGRSPPGRQDRTGRDNPWVGTPYYGPRSLGHLGWRCTV